MIREMKLGEWQIHFNRIYGRKNKWKTLEDILSRLQEEYSEVLREERKGDVKKVIDALLDIIAWIFGLCDKVGINLEQEIKHIYPSAQYFCSAFKKTKRPCPFVTEEIIEQLSLPKRGTQLLLPQREIPETLSQWQEFFLHLYGETNSQMPEYVVIARIGEELGKLAKAIRYRDKEKIIRYIVQTFAWTIGAINRCLRLGRTLSSTSKLDTLLWNKYARCPKCENPDLECICPPLPPYIVFISGPASLEEEINIIYEEIKKDRLFRPYTFKEFFKEEEIKEPRAPLDQARINLFIREKSDILICILDIKFSKWVAMEFVEALSSNKLIFVFLKDSDTLEDDQRDFVHKAVQHVRYIHRFRDKEELKKEIKSCITSVKEQWVMPQK